MKLLILLPLTMVLEMSERSDSGSFSLEAYLRCWDELCQIG